MIPRITAVTAKDRPDLVGCKVEDQRDDQRDDRLDEGEDHRRSRPQMVPGWVS